MSKLDQLRAMREVAGKRRGISKSSTVTEMKSKEELLANRSKTGLHIEAKPFKAKTPHVGPVGDGVALRSASHPVPAKRGRARIEDRDKTLAATKPWIKLKMSRRTFYRRRAEGKL